MLSIMKYIQFAPLVDLFQFDLINVKIDDLDVTAFLLSLANTDRHAIDEHCDVGKTRRRLTFRAVCLTDTSCISSGIILFTTHW